MSRVASGFLGGGLPFDRLGSGPQDIVVFPGLAFENRPASKLAAGALLGPFDFLERDFTAHVVYRRPHLPRGSTIATMADDYAAMIRTEFGGPVDLVGVSTGGSIAQQLAVDYSELVRRLVLYSTAYRLGEDGKEFQRRQAELAKAGRWGTAMAESMALMLLPRRGLGRWLTLPVRWFLALLGAVIPKPSDPSDFVTTVEAEDAFDLGSRLGEIRAPTLVVAGARDPFYSPDLFRATAAGIPGARLVLEPRGGHVPTGDRIARAILGFLGANDRTRSGSGYLWHPRA
jgi:pimeloyl-ACP methyl ester carboxylesterase